MQADTPFEVQVFLSQDIATSTEDPGLSGCIFRQSCKLEMVDKCVLWGAGGGDIFCECFVMPSSLSTEILMKIVEQQRFGKFLSTQTSGVYVRVITFCKSFYLILITMR